MTAKPVAAEGILGDDHRQTDHHGVCDAYLIVTAKTIAAEDGTADNGLQQVVRETHATKDTEMMEHSTNALEGIPGRDDCRDDHQQDDEVVDRFEPEVQLTEIHETQRKDDDSRANEDVMPYLQITPLVIKQPLPPQLHAEDEKAEQLREPSAEDIEPQIHLEAIS